MSAAVVRGLVISIGIITALSVALLENPQVKAWVEEQREKIAELLRHVGEDLDPETRRQAEAFSFEGRTPANNAGLRREAAASINAAAVATGVNLSNPSTIRRIPVQGATSPEAEERKRKGAEYLAKRSQTLSELQQRSKGGQGSGSRALSSTSFDSLVDEEGRLKQNVSFVEDTADDPPISVPLELPLRSAASSIPVGVQQEMREVERQLAQAVPVAAESSAGMSGFRSGAQVADPFGDEFVMERSITPRPLQRMESPGPPVPPKVRFDEQPQQAAPLPSLGSYNVDDELTYEEQIAIALSISEVETAAKADAARNVHFEDEQELQAAIAASLQDAQRAAPAITDGLRALADDGHQTRFAPSITHSEDDLYCLTPQLTTARLAEHTAQQTNSAPSAASIPYDPVREAAVKHHEVLEQDAGMEASFYSAPSSANLLVSARDTRNPSTVASLIDLDNESPRFAPPLAGHFEAQRTPPESSTFYEASEIDHVEAEDDVDVDILSEDGNSVLTPDSWTEVGSQDGESEFNQPETRPNVAA